MKTIKIDEETYERFRRWQKKQGFYGDEDSDLINWLLNNRIGRENWYNY